MQPPLTAELDARLAERVGISIPKEAWSQTGGTFFAAKLDDKDYRFWNNTLKIEYPKVITWINKAVSSNDGSITLAKLHVLCEIVRKNLGTAKARCYAPPPLTAANGSGRKTDLASNLSPDEKCKKLRATSESIRRTLLRVLDTCPIFTEGTNDTKAKLLNGVIVHINTALRNKAFTVYQIDSSTDFAAGTYISNLSLGTSAKFDGHSVALTAGEIFTTPAVESDEEVPDSPPPNLLPGGKSSSKKRKTSSGSEGSIKRTKTSASVKENDDGTTEQVLPDILSDGSSALGSGSPKTTVKATIAALDSCGEEDSLSASGEHTEPVEAVREPQDSTICDDGGVANGKQLR
ncbi:hypothetical protein LTR27_001922 [Elasticomyces elasticus]|nr:hypothetical protein LTR27_001922 [Elasticomyces elasticus]